VWDKPGLFYVAVATPCVSALLLAFALTSIPSCGLAKPERVSVAIETCYQNVGVATAVSLSMFKGKEKAQAVGVPLYYGFVEAVLLAVFCLVAWKSGWTLAPSNADDVLGLSKNQNQHQHQQGNNDEEEEEEGAVTKPKKNALRLGRTEDAGGGGGWWGLRCLVACQREVRALRVVISSDYQPRRGASVVGGGPEYRDPDDDEKTETNKTRPVPVVMELSKPGGPPL